MVHLKSIKKRALFLFSSLSILFSSTSYLLAEGECWYLEMPKQHANYLIEQSTEADQAKYDKALVSLANFIKKGTIKEIDICLRPKGEYKQEISGKRHPMKENTTLDNSFFLTGAHYSSYQDMFGNGYSWGQFNLNRPLTAKEQHIHQIYTNRIVSKKWSPTFVKYVGNKCHVLLERDNRSKLDKPLVKSHLTVKLSIPGIEDFTLLWILPTTEVSKSFRADYLDTTYLLSRNGDIIGDKGLTIKIRGKSNKQIRTGVIHNLIKGSKTTMHRIDLDEIPKNKVELQFHITGNKGIVKEGKQGSLEMTLTPVANQ